MSKRVFYCCVLVFLLLAGSIGSCTYVQLKRQEKEIEMNAQTEVERIKIEQENEVKRTKERMKWIPWYSAEEE